MCPFVDSFFFLFSRMVGLITFMSPNYFVTSNVSSSERSHVGSIFNTEERAENGWLVTS